MPAHFSSVRASRLSEWCPWRIHEHHKSAHLRDDSFEHLFRRHAERHELVAHVKSVTRQHFLQRCAHDFFRFVRGQQSKRVVDAFVNGTAVVQTQSFHGMYSMLSFESQVGLDSEHDHRGLHVFESAQLSDVVEQELVLNV